MVPEYIVVLRQTADVLNEPVVYAGCADSEVTYKVLPGRNETDEGETRRRDSTIDERSEVRSAANRRKQRVREKEGRGIERLRRSATHFRRSSTDRKPPKDSATSAWKMFRAYGTAPAETPSGADLYSWTTPIFNKGALRSHHLTFSFRLIYSSSILLVAQFRSHVTRRNFARSFLDLDVT